MRTFFQHFYFRKNKIRILGVTDYSSQFTIYKRFYFGKSQIYYPYKQYIRNK